MKRLLSRLRLRRVSRCGNDVMVQGRLWIHGRGAVEVGDHTRFDGGVSGIELHPERRARIIIGASCRLHEGVSIEACELVTIGRNVTVGSWAKILDNDFHPLDGDRAARPVSQPVTIDDGVVIGSRAIVRPGVHIGAAARVADGAVVTRHVRPGHVVAGNPARPVRCR